MANQLDIDTIRERAEKRVKRRKAFYEHFGWYVGTNLFLWGIWLFTGHDYPWPMWVTAFWGIGVIFDALDAFAQTRLGEAQHENAVQREIERELKYHGLTPEEVMEKPKRGRELRLSDDGELVPADSDEEDNIKQKRDQL